MNPNQRLYLKNLFSTSQTDILKFYFACYKVQQKKEPNKKAIDIISEYEKTAIYTGKMSNIIKIPFIPNSSANLKNVSVLLSRKKEIIASLFQKEMITNSDLDELLYGIKLENDMLTENPYTDKLKTYILEIRKNPKRKSIGDIIFGYYLKSKNITKKKDCENYFKTIIGVKCSNYKYLMHPETNPTKQKLHVFLLKLDIVLSVYTRLEDEEMVNMINHDIEKLRADNLINSSIIKR